MPIRGRFSAPIDRLVAVTSQSAPRRRAFYPQGVLRITLCGGHQERGGLRSAGAGRQRDVSATGCTGHRLPGCSGRSCPGSGEALQRSRSSPPPRASRAHRPDSATRLRQGSVPWYCDIRYSRMAYGHGSEIPRRRRTARTGGHCAGTLDLPATGRRVVDQPLGSPCRGAPGDSRATAGCGWIGRCAPRAAGLADVRRRRRADLSAHGVFDERAANLTPGEQAELVAFAKQMVDAYRTRR